jgi:hypothetical protein
MQPRLSERKQRVPDVDTGGVFAMLFSIGTTG